MQDCALHLLPLKNILIKHLEAHAIHAFKFVPVEQYTEQLTLLNQSLDVIKKLQAAFKNSENIDADILGAHQSTLLDTYRELEGKLKSTGLRLRNWPSNEYRVECLIEELTCIQDDINKNGARFFHGDQFTIYIPESFDPNAVLMLCQDINNYLDAAHPTPGQHSDVASVIGHCISLRQEFLLADFKEINSNMAYDWKKRINTLPSNSLSPEEKTAEQMKRTAVKIEQDSSKLYQFLVANLNRNTLATAATTTDQNSSSSVAVVMHIAQPDASTQQSSPGNKGLFGKNLPSGRAGEIDTTQHSDSPQKDPKNKPGGPHFRRPGLG